MDSWKRAFAQQKCTPELLALLALDTVQPVLPSAAVEVGGICLRGGVGVVSVWRVVYRALAYLAFLRSSRSLLTDPPPPPTPPQPQAQLRSQLEPQFHRLLDGYLALWKLASTSIGQVWRRTTGSRRRLTFRARASPAACSLLFL